MTDSLCRKQKLADSFISCVKRQPRMDLNLGKNKIKWYWAYIKIVTDTVVERMHECLKKPRVKERSIRMRGMHMRHLGIHF